MRTDGINYDIPDNFQLKNLQGSQLNKTYLISLELRECQIGEERLPTGKCQNCLTGYFLLEAPKALQLCKPCVSSEKASCEGSNKIYPKPGYWRSSIFSENFIPCRNDEACLGKNDQEQNVFGACQRGY
jgi:hypothetical protein